MLRVRPATRADVPAVEELIQVESLLAYVFGTDTQLIEDGTYFIVQRGEQIVAAGGWSRRRTLFGGDQMKDREDPLLDPGSEPARIRAFFVHPAAARQGLGRRLFDECRSAGA